jgi:hypothetical protein
LGKDSISAVMVNYMCQFVWAKGCLDIKHVFVRVFLDEINIWMGRLNGKMRFIETIPGMGERR